MRASRGMGSLLVTFALTACGATGPDDGAPTPIGVDFGLAEGDFGNHHGEGQPASGAPLADWFAVAVPDSLGGLIVLSYDDRSSNLFILQVSSATTGTFDCGSVTTGSPCHGRLFENVREEEGMVQVDGQLDVTEGTLELREVGPDEVEGSFSASLVRTAGTGASSLSVVNGSILVDLLEGPVENGDLACLIRLTVGATDCSW